MNEKMAYEEAQTLVKLKPKRTDLYDFMFDYLNARGEYVKIIHAKLLEMLDQFPF